MKVEGTLFVMRACIVFRITDGTWRWSRYWKTLWKKETAVMNSLISKKAKKTGRNSEQ